MRARIQAEYNPGAKCDKWLKFLEDVQPDKMERQSLQEFSGYCLIPSLPYHKLLIEHGTGRNGKGSFNRTIESILGTDNVSKIGISDLDGGHRFSAAELYGKLLNVSSEPATAMVLQTEQLKDLTGGDSISAEVKYRQNRIKFLPFAKHIIVGNKFPRIEDDTVAWWDRVLYTEWTHLYRGIGETDT